MNKPLWDKGGPTVDPRVQRFLAGVDVLLDREILPFDIRATTAHVNGLCRIGVLSEDERAALCGALDELGWALSDGTFVLDERFEDGHSAIESFLGDRLGETGRKVHTGRSRNDQVLVATRLWLLDRLDRLAVLCRDAAVAFLRRAEVDGALPIPGYTHMQRAVPSSVGLWLAAFAESFADDLHQVRAVRELIDACPLGSAAGYGVNLPLDRDGVARELGFARLETNPLYAQNRRGKAEMLVLSALGQALLSARRFAWDLSLYTTAEFGFVHLPDVYTTGSSIMPNKRNPDPVELIRAAYAGVEAAEHEIASVLSLPSGYHRDLQATKRPVLRALPAGIEALALLPDLVVGLAFDAERMRAAIDPTLYATDRAVELAREGVPFRDAYRQVAAELDQLGQRSPEQSLAERTSPGATADLRLDSIRRRLDDVPIVAAR